jgi:hypothetical protein
LIHTYDYPPLAQRGLVAANKYAEVAPAAPPGSYRPQDVASERSAAAFNPLWITARSLARALG